MPSKHTLKVETVLQPQGMQVEGHVRKFTVRFDEPNELGGTDTGPNPVEMLLCALGACQCLTAKFVSRLKKIDLQDYRVEVEGELDFDGFLKADGSVRPGLQIIRVRTFIKSSASPAEVESLMQEVEKRCPVGDTVLHGTSIEMKYELLSD